MVELIVVVPGTVPLVNPVGALVSTPVTVEYWKVGDDGPLEIDSELPESNSGLRGW